MAKSGKRKKPRERVENLPVGPEIAGRLRAFCDKQGYLLRYVTEFALVRLLDSPPKEIPHPPERRGRPPKPGKDGAR